MKRPGGVGSPRELSCAPQERYRRARFHNKLLSGAGHFELLESELGASLANVSEENLPAADLRPGAVVDLFLERLTAAGNWICRTWPPEDNPWINGECPHRGDVVSGTIVRFINDRMAVVNISVDGTSIEALLPRENLPVIASGNISRSLSVGDRIRAEVEDIEFSSLRCRLNIATWRKAANLQAAEENRQFRRETIARLARAEESRRLPRDRTDAAPRPSPPLPGNLLKGLRILVIDDDNRLRESVVDTLGALGAETADARTAAAAAAAASQLNPTHVLVDYDLGVHADFAAITRIFARTSAKVAIFTGSPEQARPEAVRRGWGLLEKPAKLTAICEWIQNPVPATPAAATPELQRQRSGLWSVDVQTEAITREAVALLERLCQRHQCAAAIWLVQEREDVFSLGAKTPLVDLNPVNAILADLARSVVSHAINQQRALSGVVPANDPLQALTVQIGLKTPHYVAIPIVRPGMQPRVIVFLRDAAADPAVVENLAGRADHFELLIHAIQQATHSEQVETFATQGRLAVGTVHEARNALQIANSTLEQLKTALTADDLDRARTFSSVLTDELLRLERMIQVSLEQVRAERRDRLNVNRVAERIVESMRRVAHEAHGRHPVTILFKPSAARVITSISPAPLEQSLVNLIENAISFLPRSDWAQIRVEVSFREEDLATPIQVDVIDNGPGLTANQINRLFEPRVTAKSTLGTGLGLYVSRNLLAESGGALELVETTRWGGAHFRIRLPVMFGAMDDEAKG